MQPSARIKSVIEILERLAGSRIPLDGTVGDYMRHRKYIGSKDRASIVERVYAIVRAHARLSWHLTRQPQAITPRTHVLSWLMLGEGMSAVSAAKLFDGSQYGPEPLNDDEQALAAALDGKTLEQAEMDAAVRAECPPACEASLRAAFGDAFETEMLGFTTAAPLDLRVNTRLADRDTVRASLFKDGIKTDPTPYSPWGLRVQGKVFISKTKAFVKGWIDIQDEGSQLISYLCNAKPGMQVLDYCAGAGGKTLALAASMQNKGRIVAMDLEKNRLEKARPRFRRAHVHDIIEVRPLSDEKNRKWLRRQKDSFDIVLIDVPCSGTGTWRRNPDTRWQVYGPSLDDIRVSQVEIMDKVAKAVKPGGRLVYATCSLLPEENEEQVKAFLTRNPDFSILPLAQAWPDQNPPNTGDFMRLTPHRHNTDGFFAAVLVKK